MNEPKTRHYLQTGTQLIIGILMVVVVLFILQALLSYVQVTTTPTGWQIIRPPYEVSTILIDNNTVWTGGKGGVILIDRLTGNPIPTPPGSPPFGYVRAIFKDHTGTIWIGHDAGLARFYQDQWTIVAPHKEVPFTKVLSIAEKPDGTILAGTDANIFELKNSVWQGLFFAEEPGIFSADVVFVDSDGMIWAGCSAPTHGVLYRSGGSSWQEYTTNDGLPHTSVRAITETKDGAIWVAAGFSRHGGAARYMNKTWSNLTINDGLAGESTRSVFEDFSGRLWIGSEYDGIAVVNNGTITIIAEKDGLAGNEVKVMKQDQDGNYWLGTEKGLSRIVSDGI